MDLTNTGIYNGDTYLARPIELHRGMAARKSISNAVSFELDVMSLKPTTV